MRDLPVPPTNNVQMVDYVFGQNNIIVPVGTLVTWRKTGATTHTATALEESWVHAGATATLQAIGAGGVISSAAAIRSNERSQSGGLR